MTTVCSVGTVVGEDDALIEDTLRAVRELLGMEVAYLASARDGLLDFQWLSGDASSFGIAAGQPVPLAGTYCELVLDGAMDGVVPDARRDPRVAHLAVTRDAGIGAYLGVPVVLPDGRVHGVLCGLSHEANLLLGRVEHDMLGVLGRLIAKELQGASDGRASQRSELAESTIGADDEHAVRPDAGGDRVAFEEAPIGNVVVDRDGRIQRVNEALCAITGLARDELVGASYFDLVHPDERTASTMAVATVLRSSVRGTHRAERRLVHSSGRIVTARVAVSAIVGADHRVEQLFVQVEDVTEMRWTERELHHAQSEMLARLAAAAEFRDDDTGQHTRRVATLSAAIAGRLALGTDEVELIRAAAPLHDIGKIAIPDALLTKAGPLSRDEFEHMKTHTVTGWRMLSGSSFALMEMAAEIALTHHERWDGSGYPAGLAGTAIPVSGRIVAVADVFDALTHARPYKKKWSRSDALREMAAQSGRHFDPSVLRAFLELQGDVPADASHWDRGEGSHLSAAARQAHTSAEHCACSPTPSPVVALRTSSPPYRSLAI